MTFLENLSYYENVISGGSILAESRLVFSEFSFNYIRLIFITFLIIKIFSCWNECYEIKILNSK
jgi:hypothetical protein